MKAEGLKEHFFGGFLHWLTIQGVGDRFSMDIWMSRIWDILYRQYMTSRMEKPTPVKPKPSFLGRIFKKKG